MEDLTERRVSGETIYSGHVFTVERDNIALPDGRPAVREIVRHNGGVCIAALDENNNLFFVRQYRYAFSCELDELPAGKLERGEQPDAAALRELEEETGYTASSIRRVAVNYPSPGYTSEKLYLYLATGLSYVGQKLDADEFLRVSRVPLERAVQLVLDGSICDSKSQTLILLTDKIINE